MPYGNNAQHTAAFFQQWERTGERGSSFVPSETDETIPVSRGAFSLYDACWQDEWYQDDAQRNEYRQRGKQALTAYHQWLTEHQPRPLFSNKDSPFNFWCHHKRSDRSNRAYQTVWSDRYKTGRPKTEKDLEWSDKDQLLLYQLACERVLKLKPKRLTFHYLRITQWFRFSERRTTGSL